MANKQIQEIEMRISRASVDSAEAMTKPFAKQKKLVDNLLQSLQLVENKLKSIKMEQIAGTRNYVKGAAASQETQVQKAAITADAKRIQAYKDLMKLDQERGALLLSQSKLLDDQSRGLRKITDLEQLSLNLKAAQFRAKEAQLQQDTKEQRAAERMAARFQKRIDQVKAESAAKEAAQKREQQGLAAMDRMAAQIDIGRARRQQDFMAAMRRMNQEIDTGLRERDRRERALDTARRKALEDQMRLQQRANALEEKRRMQPITDRQNAQRSRELSELRLFGDGGASLLRIQTSLMANYAAINAVRGAFSAAISESTAFDNSLRNLQAVAVITDGNLVGLKKTLLETADAGRFSVSEVSKASLVLAQAGLSNDQIRTSIGAISDLAVATGTDFSKAVDIATSVMGVFNIEAGRMAEVSNTLTAAMNSSKLDIEKLSLGIQYAGNTAYDAGVSFEELTAGLGAMANAGIRSGSTLGTGMRQILVSLEKPSEKFAENLAKIGLSTADVDLKSKGLYQVMKTLKDSGFSAADAIESFEVRSAAAFIALSNNLPLMETMQESFYGSAAASKAQETQMRSLESQSKRFQSTLSSLVYVGLEPLLYGLRDTLSAMSDWFISLRENEGAVQTVTTAIGTFGTALVALKIGQLTMGFMGLLPAMKGFSAMLGMFPAQLAAVNAAQMRTTVSTNVFAVAIGNFTRQLAMARRAAMIAGTSMLTMGNMARVAAIGMTALWSTMGVLLPVVAALGAAYYAYSSANSSFTNETDRLNSALDIQRTKVDQAKGVVDQYKAKIVEVETKIQSLSNRSKELNKNQDLLAKEISHVRSQFTGMNTSIDGTESNVEQLIGKLQALWTQLQQEYILKVGVQIANLGGLATMIGAQKTLAMGDLGKAAASVQTSDPELNKLAAAMTDPKLRNDPLAFADAQARYNERLNQRTALLNDPRGLDAAALEVVMKGQADAANRSGQPVEPVNMTAERLAAKTAAARKQLVETLTADVKSGSEFSATIGTIGNFDAQLMDIQSQTALAQNEQTVATDRVKLSPVTKKRLITENEVKDALGKAALQYKDDPVGLYNENLRLAELYSPVIEGVLTNVKGQGLSPEAVDEQTAAWGAIKGSLNEAVSSSFSDASRVTDRVEAKTVASQEYITSGALSSVGKADTIAATEKARLNAIEQSGRLLDQELAAIQSNVPKGQKKTQDILDLEAAAQTKNDERLRRIEEAAAEQVSGINAGTTGRNAFLQNEFDQFTQGLDAGVRTAESGLKSGASLKSDGIAAMEVQMSLARTRAAQVAAELEPLAQKAAAGQMSKGTEEYATYQRLANEQEKLTDFLNKTEDRVYDIKNDRETTYGFDPERKRAFDSKMLDYQDQIESIRVEADLGTKKPEQATVAFKDVQNRVAADLARVENELAVIQAKPEATRTRFEKMTFEQGTKEVKQLKRLLVSNKSAAEGADTNGGGGSSTGTADAGAGRDFNLMMDNFKTGMSDTQQDLKYNDISGPEAVSQMEAIVAKAKEELDLRRQQMTVQKEGSAEYNRLKSEERTLLGFIREEEAGIRDIKEEQGLAQIDLLGSVRAWATENLNIGRGLEEGFLGVLGSMKTGLSTLFTDLMSGTKSAKDAFRDFAMSVVQAIQNVIAEMMAMYIMKKILGVFGMTMTGGGAEIVPISQMTGGAVRKAGGGEVTGNVARDSKLHMLMPGEYVLRKKAVDMIGLEALNSMNAMGNRAMASGGHVGVANQKKGPLGQTNVYVVAPEQQPVPGPSDIIAVINDDIARGGTTKKLIKTVAMGY